MAIYLWLAVQAWGQTSSFQTSLLSYFAPPPQSPQCCAAADRSGNVFVVAWVLGSGGSNLNDVSVTEFDSNLRGKKIFDQMIPVVPVAVAIDPSGNIWMTGAAELMEIAAGQLALTIPLGGSETTQTTVAKALAIDESGNVYVTGTTSQADFPVTPGAFQSYPATENSYILGFVSKYSPSGARLASTLVRGTEINCPSGGCGSAVTTPSTIAVSVGGVTIAGTTNTIDFPVSPGAPQPACSNCIEGEGNIFLTRLNADLTALEWSTYLGGVASSIDTFQTETVAALTLAPDGGAVVCGTTYDLNFPTTPGSFQPGLSPLSPGGDHAYVTRIDTTGTAWIFSTYLTGGSFDQIKGMSADARGNAWVAGEFPGLTVLPGSLASGTDLVVELSADGSQMLLSEQFPAGSAGPVLANSDGSFTLVSAQSLLRIPNSAIGGVSLIGIADSAAFQTAGTVAPGEFLSIYGTGLGPAPGLSGNLATSAGGTQVLFDGIAMPLLWASANQINVIAPHEIANASVTTLQVIAAGGSSQTLALTVVPAQPNIFVITNQDGTVNSASNPAKVGSYLTIWASGAGALNPAVPDGAIAGNPAPSPVAAVGVVLNRTGNCGNEGETVTYAGASPGSVADLLQVNFQFERQTEFFECISEDTVQLLIGNGTSNAYPVYGSQ